VVIFFIRSALGGDGVGGKDGDSASIPPSTSSPSDRSDRGGDRRDVVMVD